MKMPDFKEDRDCLDAYLMRFERTCNAYKVPNELWKITPVRTLDGKALEVNQRTEVEKAQHYEKWKEELLGRFKLTKGGYRKKFKQSCRRKDETLTQFVERLKRYLKQWQQMALSVNKEGLEYLILRDHVYIMCVK